MYRLAAPHSLLRPFIDNYWFFDALPGQSAVLEERIFVDARADLLFNFGCGYLRHSLADGGTKESLPRSNLDAQRRYPVLIEQCGDIHLVGVRFRAGGLAAFLPAPMYELSDLTLDVDSALGQAAGELEGRLYDAARDSEMQTALLDDFFLKRLTLPPAYDFCHFIAGRIEAAGGDVRLERLAREAGYSLRSIDRFFRAAFGVSPKFYARIIRFQRALTTLARQPEANLPNLALACGYYDQPHFAKEFSAFAGEAPGRYVDYLQSKRAAPAPNLVHFLQA